MANPPPTIAGPPPGVASSHTNGTEHLDPVHRAIYDLAQQYFANRPFSLLTGTAPSPWPYGPHPLLSAYPPAAQMGPPFVMPGPGLMLQTGLPFQWLPPFMPEAGQLHAAPSPEHYSPPAPLPAESPAPQPVPLSSASSPKRPALPSSSPAEQKGDASFVASSDSFPPQEPSEGDDQNTSISNLRAIKEEAEERVKQQVQNRGAFMQQMACKVCDLDINPKSLSALKKHAVEQHDGVVHCWYPDCERECVNDKDPYGHFYMHNFGTTTYVCGNCAMGEHGTKFHSGNEICLRLDELKKHCATGNEVHPSPPDEFVKFQVEIQEKDAFKRIGSVVYLFDKRPPQHVINVLSEDNKREQWKWILSEKRINLARFHKDKKK
ncbi:MAG: hypothetical protein H7A36_00140 [Chlamydiales bacterium]|nr:hypothetical protein [Chlamydiales bacterium]